MRINWMIVGFLTVAGLALFQFLVVIPTAREATRITGYGTLAANQAALQRDSNDPRAHIGLAENALAKRDLPEAEKQWREVVRLDPGNNHARHMLASTLMRQDKKNAPQLDKKVEGLRMMQQLAERDDTYGTSAKKFLENIKSKPNWDAARAAVKSSSP